MLKMNVRLVGLNVGHSFMVYLSHWLHLNISKISYCFFISYFLFSVCILNLVFFGQVDRGIIYGLLCYPWDN